MLNELFIKGYLNYSKLILENAKVLGLNASEAFILIKILDNYHESHSLSIEKLSNQVLINSNNLDQIVVTLMERGYYEIFISYENGKGEECISFKPLFAMIENIVNNNVDLDKYDIEKANRYLVNSMNRVLTANELETLQGLMVDDHYSYNEIVEATNEIIKSRRVLSLRTLTSTLANRKLNVTAHKEAPKAFKDFLSKL